MSRETTNLLEAAEAAVGRAREADVFARAHRQNGKYNPESVAVIELGAAMELAKVGTYFTDEGERLRERAHTRLA